MNESDNVGRELRIQGTAVLTGLNPLIGAAFGGLIRLG